MIIYSAEKEAGLTEALSAKSSIVYASLAEKCDNISNTKKIMHENQALAGIEDSDLYYTQSILVTTSWNKNDDIFDPQQVWDARNTPEDKPTNLEHDENIIVGHITSNWPIDDDGNIIDQTTTNLPEKFHILTGSVIYKGYTDPILRSRASNLIEEIESGNKYVSMECFFKGFDYGIIDKSTGKYHILPRNEETAFLTKYLRAYGGQGEHQNYKLGRVLRDITFSGKGFVDKPANPESIIFTKENLKVNAEETIIKNYIEKNNDSINEGVSSNKANLKETNMSVDPEVPQSEEVVAPVADVVETTVDAPAETEASKIDYTTELNNIKATLETLKQELFVANETIAGYKNKEAEVMKKEKKMKRIATLIESGIDNETAEATVEKFDALDDETFASVTALVAAKKMTKKEEEVSEEPMKKKASVDADESVLETAEVEDSVNLSIASDNEDNQIQNTRAALVDFVCIRLGKKLNKGE